jgi:3-oxoadipate enol-lactonase
MPYARNGKVRIYWEEEGAGDPLLMIMGLGFGMAMWRAVRQWMAGSFRAIMFDNRGIGRSDIPRLPFPLSAMARDAAAVMDAAGAGQAHVMGFSMGGMIAQELALRYPDRVRRLVLAGTHCGLPGGVLAEPTALRALLPNPWRPMMEIVDDIVPFIYAPETPRERIDADLEVLSHNLPTRRGYLEQLAAVVAWRSCRRLPRIKAPTLAIHGECDRLVPAENARILAARIPGAKLTIIPAASHIFPTDQPEIARAELLGFLLAHPVLPAGALFDARGSVRGAE